MAEIAVQPGPVNRTRYDPAGIFDCAIGVQGFCQRVFRNVRRIADDHEAPRGYKRCGGDDVAELLRREHDVQHTGIMAHDLSAAVLRGKRCFGQERPIAVLGLIEQWHAIAAFQLFDLLLIVAFLICLIEVHRLCDGAVRHQESGRLRRDRQFLAVLSFDLILECHAIVIDAADNAIGDAVLFKVHRELCAGRIDMALLRADQIVGIRHGLGLGVHKGQTCAEIAQIGDQAGGRSADHGVAVSGGCEYDGTVVAQGKQGLNGAIRGNSGPRIFRAVSNDDIQGRGLRYAVQFHIAGDRRSTVSHCYNRTILYSGNGFIAAAVGDGCIRQVRLDVLQAAPTDPADITGHVDRRGFAHLHPGLFGSRCDAGQIFLRFLVAVEAGIRPSRAAAAVCIQGQNLCPFRNGHFQSAVVRRNLVSIVRECLCEDRLSVR